MKVLRNSLILGLIVAPALAMAQQLTGFENLLTSIGRLVGRALPIVVGIALLAFFWGLIKFIFSSGNPEGKTEGKHIMIWGIIALFVMVSVWGLVGFLGTALNIDTTKTATTPGVQGL